MYFDLDMDQRIVSKIHIAGPLKKILVLSIHIATPPATNDIDMAIRIAPSRACILKPSIRTAGWLHKILNEKYRITYRIVEGVVLSFRFLLIGTLMRVAGRMTSRY